MGTLYIISTPIGNLEDISLRALRILKEADFILCEDTRITRKLLERYEISKLLFSYHQHSNIKRIDFVIENLKKGKNIALVSDAGTPGISDPGNFLVKTVIDDLGDNVKIIPIPGPSALVAAASVCGKNTDKFLFLGFLPRKKNRNKYLKMMASADFPVVFYESSHRILKTLSELKNFFEKENNEKGKDIFVGRELTKKFETLYRGEIGEVIKKIEKDKSLGEFVVIV